MRTLLTRGLIGLTLLFSYAMPAHAAFDSALAEADKRLEIIRITPDGEDAFAGKQIVIQFNRAVVPLGKMERMATEIPVTITPNVACAWRWLNTSALACDLPDNAPLKEATHYTLAVNTGIKAEDGTTITHAVQHQFTTARPYARDVNFHLWKAPTHPVLRIVFNQPVTERSVQEHIYFSVGDKQTARSQVRVSADEESRLLPRLMQAPSELYALLFTETPPQKSDANVMTTKDGEARRVWLVEPSSELPLDTHVVLKSEAGLVSALGAEKGTMTNDLVQFDTYPEFAFLGVRCINNADKMIDIKAGEQPSEKCNPLNPVYLSFSAPVEREKIGHNIQFTPAIGGWKQATDNEEGVESEEATEYSSADASIGRLYRMPHRKGDTYEFWVPAGLKAAQSYSLTLHKDVPLTKKAWQWLTSWFNDTDPLEVQDIFGRTLPQSSMAYFATDHRKPNYVLDYSDAVLEKNVDSEVPFYVNNLQDYSFNYGYVNATDAAQGLTFQKRVPYVEDKQFAVPLGVREMLNGKTGAVFGTLHTSPKVSDYPPRLFAQVTPYQVHFKLGHFNSLVWVTDMATGQPVEGAHVALYKDAFTTMRVAKEVDAEAISDASGLAVLAGTDTLDPHLDYTDKYDDKDLRYFLRVQKGDDMALLPVSYAFKIDTFRSTGSEEVYMFPTNKDAFGHMQAWGTTAQGIYRAGDTIQYKIYVRDQNVHGYMPAPSEGYRLQIIDPMGKIVQRINNVTLSQFGGISGEFAVPKEAAVGWYQFRLFADFAQRSDGDEYIQQPEDSGDSADGRNNEQASEHEAEDLNNATRKMFVPMRVLVSDFTPSPFKVSGQLNGDLFHRDEQVEVTTRAELHSGGAYTDATARITALLDSKPFTSKVPTLSGFQFDSFQYETPSQQLFQKLDKVTDKGELTTRFNTGSANIVYGTLTVESAVADDRGKYVTGQSSAAYVGVDRLVGLHNKDWLFTVGKPAKIEYIVVDERGNPAKGTQVAITIEHEVSKAARVKGAGNAYITEYHSEWEAAGNCNGISQDAPLTCDFTPTKSGSYRATAKIKDSKGSNHSTVLSAYATGSDFVMWDNGSDSSLTIIPERTDYKVGETARFLVKNPYPHTKALITVERYGVLDHFVQNLDSSTPVIEVKVKPDYLPGFYLSVVIVSPRVEKPLGEGQIDLGKPTYRMGYAMIDVQDPYKEMLITSKTDKAVYRPREKVTVQIHAEPRVKDKNEPIELMVTVLDESVFDLITGGKNNFNPYKGFYKLDNLDLRNYSLLTRLIGRQRFEKKGANPGGDGGADLSMRSMFKFVSYWNAELQTDKDGNATVSFDAPDNLTGWRILAIATTPTDRFGLGDANFKVNRPTEVRPVMPNQVLEGDDFNAGFSVMNRTDKTRTLTVNLAAEGTLDASVHPSSSSTTVTLAPYKRTTVFLPIRAASLPRNNDASKGSVQFTATAEDATDRDGMSHNVPVHPRRAQEVAANYGTTTQDHAQESIMLPKDSVPDSGSVSVIASPTVIGNITGAFSYMRDYPYFCWEQTLSKAVMAAHYNRLKAYVADALTWNGSDVLPQTALDKASGFQANNGGMSYFVPQDQYVDPYLSAYTALAFNWLREAGYTIPQPVESKLHDYLRNMLKNDAVPDFYSEGMTSTVRAVALAALAQQGKIELHDLERYVPHVPRMSLLGKSFFLQASLAIKGGEIYAADVAKRILANSNETGGKFIFNETWDDSYSRILVSPLRENCAVLDAFTTYGERPEGAALVGDIPFKLVRSITQSRKNRDHWENTQENLFCTHALAHFANVYEKDTPEMTVNATLNGQAFGTATFKDFSDPAVLMSSPMLPSDIGKTSTVNIDRQGTGRLYYTTRVAYALPTEKTTATNAGIEVHREYSVQRDGKWQLLTPPLHVTQGELVRVDLYLSAPAARNFVVLDDAVAGGLEPVNRELATTSAVDAKQAEFAAAGGAFWFKYTDWISFGVSRWNFYHQEIRHDSVRFYADYLPAGNYHLSYAAQAIATGNFSMMPAKAEEMYDPDVYGKTEAVMLHVAAPTATAATTPRSPQ